MDNNDQHVTDQIADPYLGERHLGGLDGEQPVPPVVGQPTDQATATDDDGADRPTVESLRVAANGIRDDIGKKLNDPTAVYVALGASDLVVERARQAAATAARQGAEFAEKARSWNTQVSSDASDVPRLAVSRALKVAGHVEAAYADLASRGREVAERVREGRGGGDMVRRAVATLSRRGDVTPGTGTVVLGETVESPQVVDIDPVDAGLVDPFLTADASVPAPAVPVDPLDPIGSADLAQDDAAGADPTGDDVVSGGQATDPSESTDTGPAPA